MAVTKKAQKTMDAVKQIQIQKTVYSSGCRKKCKQRQRRGDALLCLQCFSIFTANYRNSSVLSLFPWCKNTWKRCNPSILPSISDKPKEKQNPPTHTQTHAHTHMTLPPLQVKQLEWIDGFGEEREDCIREENRGRQRKEKDKNGEI